MQQTDKSGKKLIEATFGNLILKQEEWSVDCMRFNCTNKSTRRCVTTYLTSGRRYINIQNDVVCLQE